MRDEDAIARAFTDIGERLKDTFCAAMAFVLMELDDRADPIMAHISRRIQGARRVNAADGVTELRSCVGLIQSVVRPEDETPEVRCAIKTMVAMLDLAAQAVDAGVVQDP